MPIDHLAECLLDRDADLSGLDGSGMAASMGYICAAYILSQLDLGERESHEH
jgi:hypothetical protein